MLQRHHQSLSVIFNYSDPRARLPGHHNYRLEQ